MNISDVLTPVNSEGLKNDLGTDQDGFGSQVDLFSFLFNNFSGIQTKAEEQTSGESKNEQSVTLLDGNLTGSILGQNSYLQILQNLFPAGMEANSGQKGEQKLTSISMPEIVLAGMQQSGDLISGEKKISQTEGVPVSQQKNIFANNMEQTNPQVSISISQVGNQEQMTASALKDLGLEGTINPRSGEKDSLNPAELDKNIKMVQQLKELSGKIELGKNDSGQVGKSAYIASDQSVGDSQQQTDSMMSADSAKNADVIKGIEAARGIVINQKNDVALGIDVAKGLDVKGAEQTKSSGSEQNTVTGLPQLQETDGNSQQTLLSGQENKSEDSDTNSSDSKKQMDPQLTQFVLSKTAELKNMEKALEIKTSGPIEAGKVWDQVIDTLKKQDINANAIKELSIHLQPADLGKVHIKLSLENGQLNLMMNASEQATGTVLQNNLQELRNSLSQMGVACGTFEMGSQQNGQADSDRKFSSNGNEPILHLEEEEQAIYTGLNAYMPISGSGSKLNVIA